MCLVVNRREGGDLFARRSRQRPLVQPPLRRVIAITALMFACAYPSLVLDLVRAKQHSVISKFMQLRRDIDFDVITWPLRYPTSNCTRQ